MRPLPLPSIFTCRNLLTGCGCIAAYSAVSLVALPNVYAQGSGDPPRQAPSPTKSTGEVVNLRPKFVTGDRHVFTLVINNTSTQISAPDTSSGPTSSTPGVPDGIQRPSTPRVPADPKERDRRRSPETPVSPATPGLPSSVGERTGMEQRIGITLKVTDATPEKGATFDLVFDSLSVTITTPDGERLTFDSSKGSDDPLSGLLAPLIGQAINVRMDKDGNITSAGMGGALDPAAITGALTGGSANGPNAADVFKNMLGPISSASKAKGEARVGERWTNRDSIDAPWGQMRLTTNHTLTSHRGGVATIDMMGQYDLEPSSSTGGGLAPRIRESIYKGQTLWNTSKGVLDSLTFTQKLMVESGKAGTSGNEMSVKVTRNK